MVEWAANVNQSHHKLNNFVHQSSSCTLFVRNLPTTVSQETLHCRFGQFGYVASVTIIGRTLMSKKRLGFNNDSQCCAFVRYLTKVDARKAQASEVRFWILLLCSVPRRIMVTNASAVILFRMALIYTVIQFTLASRTVMLKSMTILNHPSSENHILQVDVFQLQ